MPNKPSDKDCKLPPHQGHAQKRTDDPNAATKFVRWVRAAPQERAPLPFGVGLYSAGYGVHALPDAFPWWGVGGTTAITMMVANQIIEKRYGKDDPRGKAVATKAMAAIGATGSWLAASSVFGPAFGPHGLVTWIFLGAYGAGYMVWRRDEGTKRAIKWRKDKTAWRVLAPRIGLADTKLLKPEQPTRLGTMYTISTKDTGKLASQFANAGVAERIAQYFDIPATRVLVATDKIAGRVTISVRHRDPWAKPILHPSLDDEPEFDLPPADIRKPLVVGIEPESGNPLEIKAWDEQGSHSTLVQAMRGGGKTVFLNNYMERVTACPNAVVWGIDVGKATEMQRWRDNNVLDLSACGHDEVPKALAILEMAILAYRYRAKNATQAVFEPTPEAPFIQIVIDEGWRLVDEGQYSVRELLKELGSQTRSTGIGVIFASQRGTGGATGGTDVRANFSQTVVGKVPRSTETGYAAGGAAELVPDMSKYGEGKAGVVFVTEVGETVGGGRTFLLGKELTDIDRVCEGRAATRPALEPGLVEHLGDRYALLKGNTAMPVDQAELKRYEMELEATLSPEDRDARQAWKARNAETAALAEETNEAADRVAARLADPETARKVDALMVESNRRMAEATQISQDDFTEIMDLLESGTTVLKVAEALGIDRATAWRYLTKLQGVGVAAITGKGKGRGAPALWTRADDHEE